MKRGTFLYNGTIECELCIVLSPIRYGTGDCDDPPHVANDAEEMNNRRQTTILI